ncbi:MAG: GNAT family N-acetyltransferase [Nonomuraea sp.]|nr:GNAT family N-acetyltransferase [Nonomuraea sp.]
MESLADLLADAAAGRPPAPDGSVTVLPVPSARDAGIIAFTAHTVIFAGVDPAWVRARLPADDLSAPLGPAFLTALEEETGRRAGNLDLLTLAAPLPGPAPIPLEELTGADHPRVARARRYRDDVRVWSVPGGSGLVTLGRGVAGRMEAAVEVAEEHRGRGLGRALATSARHLADEPLWAQIAPGNAASVRAFLAAGHLPMGAECLLVAGPQDVRGSERTAAR